MSTQVDGILPVSAEAGKEASLIPEISANTRIMSMNNRLLDRQAPSAARAARTVLLLNQIVGPKYFDDDVDQGPATPTLRMCSVHGSTVEDDAEMHRNLTTACIDSHYDENLMICTPCLHVYLEGKMFPLGTGDIRQRFPAATVRCWAPGCFLPLKHADIQQYADPEVFKVYDQALCERSLASDQSIIRCASPDCRCFTWADETTVNSLQRFRCPECCRETCLDCNDLYEIHHDRPCPTLKKRLSTKTKIEEFASRLRVSRKHKCPNCPMRYEKDGGCDHITCGGSVWDENAIGGCSHEFCHKCKGVWETEGHAAYCMYFYRPRHIRSLFRRVWR